MTVYKFGQPILSHVRDTKVNMERRYKHIPIAMSIVTFL